jgi:HK97 family phage portal protein
MGLFDRFFGRRDTEQRDLLPTWYGRPSMNLLTPNDAGVKVDTNTAMTVAAVLACVRLITDAISSLPCQLFDGNGNKLKGHPLADLLAREANEYMSAATWREATLASLLLTGNAYSFIERGPDQRPIGLYPLSPTATWPVRQNGVLAYQTQTDAGLQTLDPSQVLHTMFLTMDGITGINPIATMRNSLGIALAAEKMAGKFFANGGNLGSVLKLPPMSAEAIENFTKQWKQKYLGVENAHRVGVLPDGYDFKAVGFSPEAGQMIDVRRFQVHEVCRVYRVPLALIDQTANASFSSIESQERQMYEQAIRPLVTKLENELMRKLLAENERGTRIKMNMDSRMRAETSARYAAHAAGINAGFLSINEARAFEDLPPVPGGDQLLRPLNLGPVNAKPDAQRDDALTRTLITTAAERVLRKEINAIDRATRKHAGKPDELRAWAADFYGTKHRDLVAKAFAGPLQAAAAKITADDYATRHCQTGIDAISAAIDANTAAADLIDTFEQRIGTVADDILKGTDNDD